VQLIIGMLTTISRFLSDLADKTYPMIKLLSLPSLFGMNSVRPSSNNLKKYWHPHRFYVNQIPPSLY